MEDQQNYSLLTHPQLAKKIQITQIVKSQCNDDKDHNFDANRFKIPNPQVNPNYHQHQYYSHQMQQFPKLSIITKGKRAKENDT